MSNKRGIGLTVLVCIITSVLTSLLTIVVMKNNIGDTNQNSVSKKIVVNDSGKSQNIYHAVSDKAMPSVVGITTTTISNNNIFAIPTQSEGVGTGVIVDSKGYILTNSHVVSDGQAVDVKVLFNDGGEAITTFNVARVTVPTDNPQTGDNIGFYIISGILSIVGLAGAGIFYRRKQTN